MTLIYGSDDDQEEFPDRDVGELPEHDVATGPQATCFAVTDTPAQHGSGHGMYEVTSQEKSREQPEELQRRSSEASKCSSKASRCSTGCHKKERVGVRRKDFQNSAGRLQRNDSAASGKRKTCLESQSTMKKKLNSKQKSNTGHDSRLRSLDSIGSEPAALSDTRVTRKEGDKMSSSAVDISHTVSFNADLGLPVKASRSCPSPDSGGLGSDSDKDPAPKLMPEEHPSALPDQRMLSVSDVMEAELPPQIPRDRFHPEGRDPPVANGQRPSVDTRIELIQSQLDNIYDKMKRFHNIYPDIPAVDLLESQSHEDIGENEPFDVAGNSSYNLYSNRATKDSLSLSESVLVAALAEDSGQLSQHDDWTSSIMADIEAQQKFDSVKKMLQSCVGDDWMKLVGAYHYQPVPESVTSTPKEYLEAPIPARGNRSTSAPRSAYRSAPQGQHSAGVPGSTAPSDFYSSRMPTSSYRSSPHPPRAPCNEAPVPPAAPLRQAHATKGATPTTKAPIAFTSSGLDARVTTFPKSPPDRSPASVHPEFVDISPILSPLSSPRLSDIDANMTSIDIMREPYMGIYEYEPNKQQKPVFVTVSVDRYSVLTTHLAVSVAHWSGTVSLSAINLMASDRWYTAPVKAFAIELTMTVDKDGRPVSPVHVHVDDQTSVHVHLKKPKKSCMGDHGETKRRSASVHGASNLRRTGASARSRSKSPLSGPWVPPPGKSTKASSVYSWQGQSHRLEIVPHDDVGVRGGKMYELSTDEEDEVTNKMKKYERKIDELMNEVGTLRNEMVLQNSARELSYKDDMLQSTNCALLEKEAEIEDYRRELLKTERENRALRQNMGQMQDQAVLNKSEREQLNSDRDMLMKKLVEVEMDGQAAAKQVAALGTRCSVSDRFEKQLSSTDSQMLNKQKELLLERLMEFELTNRSLRRMLRERHEEEANSMRLREQRDLLLLKLRETEDSVQRLRTEVLDKSRQIADQRIQMTAQQEETMCISNKQVSLESTRAHLQKQLRQKEADCNRMAVQIRTLESKLAQERIEIDHLQGQVEVAREKGDRDKDALKKAASEFPNVRQALADTSRPNPSKLTHSTANSKPPPERGARHGCRSTEPLTVRRQLNKANLKLMERDAMMADMRSQIDGLMTCLDKISKEKSQALAENSAFKTRISELEGILTRLEDDTKNKVESATAQLQSGRPRWLQQSWRTRDSSKYGWKIVTNCSQNEASSTVNQLHDMTTLSAVEGKLQLGENEVAQLRNNLTEYERLVEEYRAQVTRTQRQADDTAMDLEQQRKETAKIQQASNDELDKVKSRLQVRLQELEPIPEMLRSTELQLQEATAKLHSHEARSKESNLLLEELTTKLEIQTKDMDVVREKWLASQDEVRTLKQKLESIEKKTQELESQNREIMCTMAKKEEAVHQANMRMDEHTRENASLQRQLEAALCDARRLSETARDKISCRDRITQQRILDLEAQVNHLRTEVTRAKREKEEAERKFNSRLYDLKDRLEQAHSTNRSMQNYVQFLKNSYSNVFGDTPLMTTSSSPFKTFH
ncbi:hypothetical protein NP493_189g05031 [Ridgeia piscesae]|uniref:Uncharacterized protein n=1 Tax=Ridgeia piscesae TaxID=27915 RepID=A0AAD9UEY3_RIDPI|nr:hypothetical protein NP493_189g05031 [Ridgeia piscesae]